MSWLTPMNAGYDLGWYEVFTRPWS